MTEDSEQPVGWSRAPLSELTEVNPSKISLTCAPNTMVNFVPMASVAEEFGGIDLSIKRPLQEVQKGYTQFRERDVIVAKITPCMENGKLAVVPVLDSEVAYGSTEFHVLRANDGVRPSWIAYFLAQSSFRRQAQRNMSGSAGQLRVPVRWLEDQIVPIAPPNEQTRITAKIEELFSDLDAGVAALERARANLKRYRAAVLKAAVEGRLTAQWRKAHPDVESASKLLERILGERRRKWEEAQLAKFATQGRTPPKGWKDKYPEPAVPNETALPALPKEWSWATLEQACDAIVDCEHSTAKFSPTGFACVDTNCIRPGEIVTHKVRYVDEKTYQFRVRRLVPRPGDLIFAREGTVGTVVLIPGGFSCCLGQRVMLFRPSRTIAGKWMEVAIDSELFRAQFRPRILGTTSPHLNVGDIKVLAIPLAPAEEEKAVIDLLGSSFAYLNRVEQDLGIETHRASRLRQAILKRAFEGKLVPQDPNDEPACVLLERIRNARAAEGTQRAHKRRKSPA